MRESHLGQKVSDETKEKMRETSKIVWANPKLRKKQRDIQNRLKTKKKKQKAESKMLEIVNKYPEIKDTYFKKEEENFDE